MEDAVWIAVHGEVNSATEVGSWNQALVLVFVHGQEALTYALPTAVTENVII